MRTTLRNPSHHAYSAELNRLVKALPVGAYTIAVDGTITAFNDRAAAIWGRCPRPEEKWCGSHKAYSSEGEPLTLECAPMGLTMSTGQPCLGHEVIVERPDGSRIRIAPFPHALYDTAGQVAGAINLLLPVAPQALSESEHMSVGRSAERLSHFLLPLADLARSIAGARHIEEAATETLELLCQTLNGALGTFWILDGKLRLRPIVCVESKPRAGRCSAFQRHTRQALLTWGSDLPGKAAASWKAVWVDNVTTDQEFRRSQLAAENGLASALAYPLIPTEGGPVRGVLELFFDEASPDHDWVHELMSGVSTLLSDFIAQQDMQRIERENRRRIQIETPGFVSAMFGRGGAMPTAASLHRRH